MARRDPNLVTSYVCCFCKEPIRWGDIVRILLQRPTGTVKQPTFAEQEVYAHTTCVRRAVHPSVPLIYPQ